MQEGPIAWTERSQRSILRLHGILEASPDKQGYPARLLANSVYASKEPTVDWNRPCNIILVHDPYSESIAIDSGRLVPDKLRENQAYLWRIDAAISIPEGSLGMPIVQAGTNRLIGVLIKTENDHSVLLW
jgi:hypothetical protein